MCHSVPEYKQTDKNMLLNTEPYIACNVPIKTYFDIKAVSGMMTLKKTSRWTGSGFRTVFSTSVIAYLKKKRILGTVRDKRN